MHVNIDHEKYPAEVFGDVPPPCVDLGGNVVAVIVVPVVEAGPHDDELDVEITSTSVPSTRRTTWQQ